MKKTNNKNKEISFKENIKNHLIKNKQPYLIGLSFGLWFLMLLLFAVAGKTAPYSNVAFSLFGLDIAWYAIFILSGAIFAVILAYREAFFLNINRDHLIDMALIGIVVGIIGARLYYVLFQSVGGIQEIFNLRSGGLAIHGGIIAGIIFVYVYTRIRKVDLFKTLDILAVGFLIGQIIGRWGNFMNQEAHGGPISANAHKYLSVIIPNFIYSNMKINGIYYHPTFLYESLWNSIGFVLLLVLRRKRVFKIGDMIGLYLIWYGVGRGLLIEPFRTDPLLFIESGSMENIFNRVNVVLSLTLFTMGGAAFIIVKNKIFTDLPYYFDVVNENKDEALYLLSKEGRQKQKEQKR